MALTKAQRSAAARKAARTRKRNAAKKNTSVTRRRRIAKKKSMLSEMFNPKLVEGGLKAMASGGASAIASQTILKVLPVNKPIHQSIALGVTSFLTATVFKLPNVASGLSAVAVYKLMESQNMLNDDFELAEFADNIESLPMYLEDGSQNEYLQDEMYLQDDPFRYDVGYYGADFGG